MRYSVTEAAKELGVTVGTLRNWEKKGKIKAEYTTGGHRRYPESEILRLLGKKSPVQNKRTAIYVRVSTPSRKNDLEMQKQVLELYCAAKGWQYTIIEDIGSGLNYNKQGLLQLIKLIENNQIDRVVLNYKDRLLRFGNEIIFEICKYHEVEVVIVNDTDSKSYEDELVEDVLSVITVFSARLYGSRSHKNQRIVKKAKELFKEDSTNDKNTKDCEATQ